MLQDVFNSLAAAADQKLEKILGRSIIRDQELRKQKKKAKLMKSSSSLKIKQSFFVMTVLNAVAISDGLIKSTTGISPVLVYDSIAPTFLKLSNLKNSPLRKEPERIILESPFTNEPGLNANEIKSEKLSYVAGSVLFSDDLFERVTGFSPISLLDPLTPNFVKLKGYKKDRTTNSDEIKETRVEQEQLESKKLSILANMSLYSDRIAEKVVGVSPIKFLDPITPPMIKLNEFRKQEDPKSKPVETSKDMQSKQKFRKKGILSSMILFSDNVCEVIVGVSPIKLLDPLTPSAIKLSPFKNHNEEINSEPRNQQTQVKTQNETANESLKMRIQAETPSETEKESPKVSLFSSIILNSDSLVKKAIGFSPIKLADPITPSMFKLLQFQEGANKPSSVEILKHNIRCDPDKYEEKHTPCLVSKVVLFSDKTVHSILGISPVTILNPITPECLELRHLCSWSKKNIGNKYPPSKLNPKNENRFLPSYRHLNQCVLSPELENEVEKGTIIQMLRMEKIRRDKEERELKKKRNYNSFLEMLNGFLKLSSDNDFEEDDFLDLDLYEQEF
ncbi:hypothetical protein HK098_004736 [Nowakowskiella sp. JEL0407]|nr:hypothetical protein HK098_004736 [Nowakowskiella sp. JEL0407]